MIVILLGTHPRFLVDGFDVAKRATLEFLEKFKTPVVIGDEPDRDTLKMIARTTLRTKVLHSFMCHIISYFSVYYSPHQVSHEVTVLQLYEGLADQLTDIVVNAVRLIPLVSHLVL